MSDSDIEQNDPIEPDGTDGGVGESVSRRRLVIGGLAAAATVAVGAASLARGATAAASQQQSSGVIVSDPSLCVGCLACEVNCKTWHASVGRAAVARIRVMSDPSVQLNTTVSSYLPGRAGNSPETCKQCPTAYCLPNCPTTGLQIDPATGVRYINEQDCIACGKCEVDCPYEWSGTQVHKEAAIASKRVFYDPVSNVYAKCDLCRGREGGPICVERCPVNVSIRAGYIKSDHLALDVKPATEDQWKRLV
jgi:Fe-S-cluster-containing dehydrogenase component